MVLYDAIHGNMVNLADHPASRTSSLPADRTSAGVQRAYAAAAAEQDAMRAVADGEARRWSRWRLVIFMVVAAVVLLTPGGEAWRLARWVGVVVLAGAFVWAAAHQRAARRVASESAARAAIAREGEARLARRWDALPRSSALALPADHAYAADLGVAGRASLLQLFGPLGVATGGATLLGWLAAPAPVEVCRARQVAARELAGRTDVRDALAVRTRLAGGLPLVVVQRFLTWAESPAWLADRGLVRALSLAAPVVNFAAIVAAVAGVVAAALPLVTATLTLVVYGLVARPVRARLTSASPADGALSGLAAPFRLIDEATLAAPAWEAVRARLGGGAAPAHGQLTRLRRTLDAAGVIHSPMLHLAVNALTLWDLHVLASLERWQQESGRQARDWFAALGEAEALAALGTLAHDHPSWCFPELEPGAAAISARGLAHPLIAPHEAVPNDVTVGPEGTVLLITGSNMAGKSTLLRAIGANVVLAQAGAPACAASLTLPPLKVASCMRVADSLEDGVSLFMAELRRLRLVVDVAREAASSSGAVPRVLYLLDEILQGTNTAERQVASRRVLHHLIAAGAIGAVTTHDLELATTLDLAAAARLVHFREVLDGTATEARMDFDYLLRPGPATSANAMRLVELVGLG